MAKPLICILIGEKWLVAAQYLQLIGLAGMFYPIYSIYLVIFQVKGRSDLFLKLEVIKVCLTILPVISGIIFGIEYMLIGNIGVALVTWFIGGKYIATITNYSLRSQLKDIYPVSLISCCIALVMYAWTWTDMNSWCMLTVQCCSGGILTFLLYESIKLPEYIEVKSVIFSVLKRNKFLHPC